MYNEQENVIPCVKTICNFLKKIENRCELLVVNDGSDDETYKKLMDLKEIHKKLNIKSHPKNLGYGAANQTGIKYAYEAGFKYVLFMDSDLTQHTNYIFDFITLMDRDIDFIKATRYSQGGGAKGVNKFRKLISRVGNFIAKTFLRLPITDYTNGFRAIKTELVQDMHHEENGFAYLIEEVNKISKKAKAMLSPIYTLCKRRITLKIEVYLFIRCLSFIP